MNKKIFTMIGAIIGSGVVLTVLGLVTQYAWALKTPVGG
jgi:hypothetical protein